MLVIYYDNPNEASDMYLKWLIKDCEKWGIDYKVVKDYNEFTILWRKHLDDQEYVSAILPLMPVKDVAIIHFLEVFGSLDVDNVAGGDYFTDATAYGIYDYIRLNYTDRRTAIAVIGRGKVGSALIDMLIGYGYTVYEFNSKSHYYDMYDVIRDYSNVAVGLSTETVFGADYCEVLNRNGVKLIDASNTFNTKDKLRCGKWTRGVILGRV